MSDTVIFYDPVFEEHKTGFGHPERPERLPAALEALEASGLLEEVAMRSPREAEAAEIRLVHSPEYIEQVKRLTESGGGHLDMDTALSEASYRAALKAAGALLDSVDGCLSGDIRNSFCMVRPPGHHALPSRGMGFCVFNNAAIAARYAISKKGLDRVMIVDWDAHHGNGTQEVFYGDSSVLYVSLHQYPHYPGTGWLDETGGNKGRGFTINIPFPPGTGEEHYLKAFERIIIPAGRDFAPDLLLISAGYDSHAGDLLCSMRLIDGSYRRMTESLSGLAEEICNGRLIVTLEGGYNIGAMARSVVQTVAAMAGADVVGQDEDPGPDSRPDMAEDVMERVVALLKESG